MISPLVSAIDDCQTLIDLISLRQQEHTDALAYRFLLSGDASGPSEEWNYGELARRAHAIAACLQEAEAQGEHALLLFPPGLEFIAAFLGCACAGVVAVPSYPHRNLSRLEVIARDAQVRFVLTTRSFLKIAKTLKLQAPELAAARWIATDDQEESVSELASRWRRPLLNSNALAFLQYTSGSTGSPKGVMVSHGNLLHNERLICQGFRTDASIHVVGWLPLYHDMGLIGNVLQPLYLGASCTLMSPLAFLEKPMRWLEAISRYKGTVSGGPNFAFDLCVRKKVPDLELDLSSWAVAFNGAEPIRKETLDRFATAFSSYGFRASAFYPCYGLAEATLFVTGSERGAGPVSRELVADAIENNQAVGVSGETPRGRTLVSSGRSSEEQAVLIVDPETRIPCSDRSIGEIWVSGPSVGCGYWNKQDETALTFQAQLASGDTRQFLRTGDLGFMIAGELFVTGRLKDLIILRGRNLYPQDIELSVESAHPAIRSGCCAAFALEINGEEQLAVAAETQLRKPDESVQAIVQAMRQSVAVQHGVHLHTVILLKPKAIPKTSSGKIRRSACRMKFLSGELEVLMASSAESDAIPESNQETLELNGAAYDAILIRHELETVDQPDKLRIIELLLQRLCARAVGVEAARINLTAAPAAIGLDSLRGMELQNDLESALGISLPEGFFWQQESLHAASEELLKIWQEQQRTNDRVNVIAAGSLEGELPVSSGQQRLWFLHQMSPDSPVYNIHFGLRMRGQLDHELFRRSLLEVANRQAVLRTVFREIDGQLRQIVLPAILDLPLLDLRGVKAEEREAQLFQAATRIAAQPFDLATGPLVRFHLAILEDHEHVLLVAQHHIVTDAWSVTLLGKELATIYRAFALASDLPPTPKLQFADYAKWEQEHLAEMEVDRAFWAERLIAVPQLRLPADHGFTQQLSYRGGRVPVRLSYEVSRRIVDLGQSEGCTPFVALLAGYSIFLHRQTGQQDFAVGTGIAQRSQNELREVAGFLVNTLALRCDFSGSPSFRKVLQRTRALVAEALLHSRLPFGEVSKLVDTDRNSNYESLLQTNFVLENVSQPQMELPEMIWQPVLWSPDGAVDGTSKFDLSLLLMESDKQFSGVFEYSADRFERATVQCFARRLETLFANLVAAPDRPIRMLPVLPGDASEVGATGWSGEERQSTSEQNIIELLIRHAQNHPDRFAMVCEGIAVSYQILVQRVRSLALRLKSEGLNAGDLISFCLKSTSDAMVAALGILAAGGVFVPLEADEPWKTMQSRLKASGVSWVITDATCGERFSNQSLRLSYLDAITETAGESEFDLNVSGHSVACVLYRSGTKGRSQGVLIQHRALSTCTFPELQASDCVSLPINFLHETACLTAFQTLAAGACIVDTGTEPLPPRKFAAYLKDHEVTVLFSSVVLVERMTRAFPRALKGVRLIICEEAWPILEKMSAKLEPGLRERIYGVAGWTETGGMYLLLPVTHLIDPGLSLHNEDLTPGSQMRLLDDQFTPVPDGVAGEIFIGTENLSPGYLNDPEQTADVFVPDPFSRAAGGRLFRTGEIARLVSGRLELGARYDRLSVSGGWRIDEEEIELALCTHQALAEACVVRTETASARKSGLTAFLVEAEGQFVLTEQLRAFLKESLPEIMVPDVLIKVAAIPRFPSGKANTGALLKMAGTTETLAASAVYEAPRNNIEQRLAEIWSQTLDRSQIGIRDNFFRLGGHSLLATQVVTRISDVFQVDLPLRRLFEAPTIAEMGNIIEAATAVRAAGQAADAIERVSREAELPLSFAQQRLWFLGQMMPGDTSYNMPGAVWIEGPLDTTALENSIREIVRRHEALRTRFPAIDGKPRQVIEQEVQLQLQLPLQDIEFLPSEIRETEALKRAREDAQRPFDLGKGPLFRFGLLRLQAEHHLLVVILHHIVSDGWSLGILTRELTALYEAFSKGRPSPLPELPIQYVDYSAWQRKWLTRAVMEQQLDYWRRQLAGVETLNLPTDRQRPPVASNRGAATDLQISRELTTRLKETGQQHGATLFMVLLTGFLTLLYRYAAQTDFAVGSPIAGRRRSEVEGLIGFFVNTLVLRTDLSGGPSFVTVLRRVKEVALEAYAHQDIPFEKLVEELAPERDLARMPFFQVMFALQNARQSDLKLGDATLRIFNIHNETSHFDLLLSLQEMEGGLNGSLEYSTDIFQQEGMVRMIHHYLMLLEGIVSDPLQLISSLPLLTPAEKNLLLVDWNRTQADYPRDKCIHELFEEQVVRDPGKTAVICGDKELTYQELYQRSQDLALYLQEHGVKPGSVVGICMERSLEMVVGLLGILQAGGAYMPLDPAHPDDRLAYMLQDGAPVVLITQAALRDRLNTSVPMIVIDAEPALSALQQSGGRRIEPIALGLTPQHLAFVIYTSGSTGRPKGVAMEQSALVNMLEWLRSTGFAAAKTLQFSAVGFDVAFQEIFSTLCIGGCLVLITEDLRRDPESLIGLIGEQSIERLFLPYVALQTLAEAAMRADAVLPALKSVITAGEQLRITPAIAWWFRSGRRLHNQYGPTEGNFATSYTLDEDVTTWQLLPPIGPPVTNQQIYILDEQGSPQPIGVPGELHIAGDGLARGYLNRAELTAEKFVPNPFEPGRRMYKTGDLARWLEDGNIQYLGRVDTQVKVRGYRIELGEIESRLNEHPEIEASVVIAQGDVGEKRLIAFYRARGSTAYDIVEVASEELRGHLLQVLPEYMAPAAFVSLGVIPLTPNGKVDRRALGRMEVRVGRAREYVGPRNLWEKGVVEIWAEVLKLGAEEIGVQDNFFHLGGHSLLATQVIARLRKAFDVDAPVRLLFESPTVSALAQALALRKQATGEVIPPLVRVPRKESIPLSFAQQRLWFLDQLTPGDVSYNLSGAMRIKGPLDVELLGRCLEEIVQRHEMLRTRFASAAGEPRQVIEEQGRVKLERMDLQGWKAEEREEEIRRRAREEARLAFDLRQCPLLRAVLLECGEEERVLLLTMHHIISDGWSIGVLLREAAALYESLGAGEPTRLQELEIQYADYSLWQREWMKGEVLDKELDYWRKKLSGVSGVLELPTDRPRGVGVGNEGRHETVELEAGLVEGLKALGRAEGATLYMVLLAGFVALLYRYSGQEEIVVGSPVAGRTRAELEGLIGFFVNTLVLRSEVRGGASFRELLKAVKETTLEAYGHQEVPFEKVVEELAPERDLGRTPLFQVMFALQNAPMPELKLGKARLCPVDFETGTANFDLSASLTELEGAAHAAVEYRTGLFDRATIVRMMGHYKMALKAIVMDVEQRVGALSLLSLAERHQLEHEWNSTAVAYELNHSVHELFERQTAITPIAPAVSCEGVILTYEELNRRANQLAHYLRKRNIGPEVQVAVCLDRGLDMFVALLGIWKAGGAYLPLDPSYPRERLLQIMADAKPSALITQQKFIDHAQGNTTETICVDRDEAVIALEDDQNLAALGSEENLAYVIYTSGSTGKPKGVMVTQQALVNQLMLSRDAFQISGEDRVLFKASFSFDASFMETFLPLIAGAEIVVAKPEGERDLEYLVQIMKERRITYVDVGPALLATLLAHSGIHECGSLRLVTCGGEVISPEAVKEFGESLDARLWNTYGPTEATVQCTLAAHLEGARVPIGQPVANMKVYVLGDEMELAPLGGQGELYVAGIGLARGYLNRPELTAERFVPNSFSSTPGERLYRTGDLTRWRADANLEFLGRVDEQVKVRGYRIELGEVETVLSQHPAVRQAVVLARKSQSLETILVAYVVPGSTITVFELREALKQKLPGYMVPAHFVILDELPLTPSGKIDRRLLLALPLSTEDIVQEQAAPRTQIEELVAQIWAQILGLKQVGVDQDFFAIGGHSLLATQVISRLREAFAVELSVRSLFESPTVSGLAKTIEKAKWAGNDLAVTQIGRAERGEALALSFAQQRLWFLDQLMPGDTSYNISGAVRIHGPLDPQVLENSLAEIVRRHEMLRTRFVSVQGEPRQVIEEQSTVKLERVDLTGWKTEEREQEIGRRAQQEAQRAFDLSNCPLLRTVLLEWGEQEHVLLLTMHHIISDGWSLGVLLREAATLYSSMKAGQPSPLPELKVQYADYSAWQRAWMSGEVLEQEIAYWRKQLGGAPPALELPTDRPRPAVARIEGAHEPVRLERELAEGLKALAQAKGATLYMVLLAGFQTLLYRYSGQSEIFVGSPVAGRTRSELEGLIGFFVNTLVMRGEVEGGERFSELVKQVKETTLDGYAHQEVPFERLVEELSPERDLSRTPLFQVMFVLQNAPLPELELGQARLYPLEFESGSAKFDWTLSLEELNGELRGSLEYKTNLFDVTTIQRMLRHYRSILTAIVAKPETSIALIPLLDEAERHQLTAEWNATARLWPEQRWVHEMFEERAASTPGALAVEFGPHRLTYAELNKRTNQLAHYLQKSGVCPEVRVAVCMERSLELVISLMAVLKAGGAYVPVDPDYPAERISFMLADAEAPVVLSQANCVRVLESCPGKLIVVDAEWPRISKESTENPGITLDPEALAYIIYTSGSTGRPKGAMNVHKGFRNRLLWMQQEYRLNESDRVLQKTPFSFDVSVWEFFWPLAVGAGLVVARPGGHQDPRYLGETIQKCGITTLHFVPSMLKVFLESGAMEKCGDLRRIICSGEALGPDVAKKCLELLPAELHNLYGPTEASIDVTYWHCQMGEASVPIGRPISNIQTYVLDEQMNVAPIGIAGELYLGGVGLARGYWRRSELTAEKFVPDPFGAEAGGRLYRTGDWARWKLDGSLEYIGRRDEQVKLRGNRIELGEIETALRQHPKVKDAAVVINQDAAGEKRLVAYLVPVEEKLPLQAYIRKYLADRVPEYMIPAVYVELKELPLSPNGKLDRRRLPAISAEHLLAENIYVAPVSPVEELLTQIWEEVLGLKGIGTQTSFFALGGHSLLATRVIARVRDIFRIDIPLRSMFESPSIASLARVIEEKLHSVMSGEERTIPTPELEQVARDGPLPLSFAQQRLWFLNQLTPGDTSYNVPGAIHIEGPLNIEALEQSLQEIVQRHEVLRTSFFEVEGEPRQVIHKELQLQLLRKDLSHVDPGNREGEILRIAEEEAQRPFDLQRAPMFRAGLLRCDKENHVLLLTLHHIVSDGWSLGVLVRELSTCYQAFNEEQPCMLNSLPIQYADFSVWQRRWLCGAVLENQVAYWRRRLQGAPPALELPTDKPRPPVQTTNGAQQDASVDPDLAYTVKLFSREHGVTVFMTLLAAFQTLLYRYTGQNDILVGTPIAGRTRIETEGLIGCFVNTLIMKTEFTDHLTFAGLMLRVKDTTLEAYAHQDLPFEKLVDELAPQRDLSRTPLFQVMFTLQNVPTYELHLGPTRLRRMEFDTQRANFELELVQSEDNAGGIQGQLEYNTDLFDPSTVVRMLGHYRVLLRGLLAEPNQPLSMLPLLTQTEHQQLVHDWNRTSYALPESSICFHQIFEDLASRTPDAIAAECGSAQFTYRKLNAYANRLSAHLRRSGAGPESIVALLMNRGTDFLICMLAVFKAGAAYLPLDPKHPVQRRLQILDQSHAAHVIGPVEMTHDLEALTQERDQAERPLFFHIEDLDLLPNQAVDLASINTLMNAAYVIYTSGSTGIPKGAVIEQLGMLNHLYAKIKDLSLERSDLVAQTASQCFDISVWQFLAPLLAGARTSILPDEIAADPKELFDAVIAQRITILETVPSLLRAALEEMESGRMTAPVFPRLRWLLLTGEALPPELVRRWLQYYPGIPIMNAYGPTECSDDVTHYAVHQRESMEGAHTPIGVPIINTQLHVLDQHMAPVPVGIPGELYVGGTCVGRGYLLDPVRTAQSFVPDVFSESGGTRLYRTGDLVRRLPDGAIVFLHRTDHQIKMRGFRIEMGEIEAALERHPDVIQSVVVLYEDERQNQRLVAYVVCRDELSTDVLRNALQQQLPDYMIPSAFVFLPALPLTPNGKLDRKALPAPPKSEHAMIGPRNLLEAKLVNIWEQVLSVGSVGVNEDFFQIGGHSLIAVRMMAMIRNEFQQSLPLATLFLNPTIAALAKILAEPHANNESRILVPIERQGAGTPFFCVHPVGGGVLCYADLARALGHERPFYGLQSPQSGSNNGETQSIEGMAALYIQEIRRVQPRGPYILGGWSLGGLIAVEMARQLVEMGEIVRPVVLFDTHLPESLSRTTSEGDNLSMLALFAADMSRLMGYDSEILEKNFLQLGAREQELLVLQTLRKEGLLSQSSPEQELHEMLQVFSRNFQTARNYSVKPVNQLVLFRAAEADAPGNLAEEWKAVTGGIIDLHVVPGDHYTMMKRPQVAVLAEQMKRYFQETDTERTLSMEA